MVSARRNVINTLWFISFFGMAITGFLHLILGTTTLNGWWMILHVSIAPLFSISLAILALYCAKKMGIDFKDVSENGLSRIFLALFVSIYPKCIIYSIQYEYMVCIIHSICVFKSAFLFSNRYVIIGHPSF